MRTSFEAIDKFLIGDNPFIGVDHLSQERWRTRNANLTDQLIVNVIETAFGHGATGITFSPHPTMLRVLGEVFEHDGESIGLFPVIPAADIYIRIAAQKGVSGLLAERLGKLGWSGWAKAVAGGGFSLLTSNPSLLLATLVDSEVIPIQNMSSTRGKLRSVFLHEIVTDMLLSFHSKRLLQDYIAHIRDKFNVRAGFVTRNFAQFASFIADAEINMDEVVIMTPFNAMGFQMNPSKGECEAALEKLRGGKVVAMSIMAAGYLNLGRAIDYLKTKRRIDSYAIGVSTVRHAAETFSQLSANLV